MTSKDVSAVVGEVYAAKYLHNSDSATSRTNSVLSGPRDLTCDNGGATNRLIMKTDWQTLMRVNLHAPTHIGQTPFMHNRAERGCNSNSVQNSGSSYSPVWFGCLRTCKSSELFRLVCVLR